MSLYTNVSSNPSNVKSPLKEPNSDADKERGLSLPERPKPTSLSELFLRQGKEREITVTAGVTYSNKQNSPSLASPSGGVTSLNGGPPSPRPPNTTTPGVVGSSEKVSVSAGFSGNNWAVRGTLSQERTPANVTNTAGLEGIFRIGGEKSLFHFATLLPIELQKIEDDLVDSLPQALGNLSAASMRLNQAENKRNAVFRLASDIIATLPEREQEQAHKILKENIELSMRQSQLTLRVATKTLPELTNFLSPTLKALSNATDQEQKEAASSYHQGLTESAIARGSR
jgi:hypothetical protein